MPELVRNEADVGPPLPFILHVLAEADAHARVVPHVAPEIADAQHSSAPRREHERVTIAACYLLDEEIAQERRHRHDARLMRLGRAEHKLAIDFGHGLDDLELVAVLCCSLA